MDNNAANSLYNLLVTRDFEPKASINGKPLPKDADGNADISQANLFSFEYKTPNKNYGTVVILLGDKNNMIVFYGDNVGRAMEGTDKQEWYQFLEQLKHFAMRNMLKFELDNISKLKYTMQGMAAIKEGLFEGYYGKKNISYSDQPKQVRLMIKHNRDIKEGEARYRAIESLFVETADGERFRVPSRSLMHGRMIARHCAEGGTPYDAFGNHINEVVSEMATLARFIRAAKHKPFTGEAAELVEAAVRHYSDLKAKAKQMISQRGYHEARESFDPAEITASSAVAESIRTMFIEQTLDSRIEEALPILAKLKETPMREADEFESWTNRIMEGMPDTPETERQLKDLMSKPLIVGADATNATEQLYDLVGDNILFDRLVDLADRDPNANCWEDPGVINRLGELGIDINATVGPESGKPEMDEAVIPDPKYAHEPPAQESDPIPDDDDEQGVAEGSENDISWMSPQQQQEYKSAKSAAQSHPEIWKQYQHYSIQDLKKEFPNQPDQELKYLLNVIQHGLDSYDPNHLLGQGRTIRTILQWKEQGQQGVAEGSQRVDTLVTKGLGLMRGPKWLDAVAAIKYQVGERDYRERKQFYDFFVQQLVDMYAKKDVAEVSLENKYSNLSNRGVNRGIRRAGDDFNRLLDLDQAQSPPYKTQHQQATTQRLKTNPMAGPKGQLPEQGVAGGYGDSSIASALTGHIMRQRLDLLKKYGPVKVTQAIDDAAEFFGDVEEIGSSDMYAYVQYVEKALGNMNEQGLAEGTGRGIMLNGKEVDMRSLEIENVDPRDYPDFSDAYIGRASFTDGTDLSDQEMDQLNDEHGDLVHELAYDSLHESDLGEDLDTDGVMMTKPSNMSSESATLDLERLKRLALM